MAMECRNVLVVEGEECKGVDGAERIRGVGEFSRGGTSNYRRLSSLSWSCRTCRLMRDSWDLREELWAQRGNLLGCSRLDGWLADD